MYQATREQTIRRGYDPRKYTFVAFGGAGPLHAVDIAEELGVTKVLVPPAPGIASARGLLTGDIQYDNQVTISQRLEDIDEDTIVERFDALRQRGYDQLRSDGIDDSRIELQESIDMLYEGQGFELNVKFDGVNDDWRSNHRDRFEQRHETEYGHYFEEDPIELLNLRVSAQAKSHPYEPITVDTGSDLADAKRNETEVYFGDSRDEKIYSVTRYDRTKIGADTTIDGPAIIDSTDSTVIIKPDWEATVLPTRSILITHQE
jgi:N-methylhydantoinase A